MSEAKQKSEFVVLKHSYTYHTCPKCDGSGKLPSVPFRKMTFVHDCPDCDKGRIRNAITEEVPFMEALTEALTEIESRTNYH